MSSYDQLVMRYWLMVAAYVAVLTLVASVLVLAASLAGATRAEDAATREALRRPRRNRRTARPLASGSDLSAAERSSTALRAPLSRESFASDHDRVSSKGRRSLRP